MSDENNGHDYKTLMIVLLSVFAAFAAYIAKDAKDRAEKLTDEVTALRLKVERQSVEIEHLRMK